MIAFATTATDFKALAAYLVAGKGGRHPERLGWVETRNLPTDDPDLVPELMRATADLSRRCRKPAYHLAISFAKDEHPSRDQMVAVADRLLSDLGLSEHQAAIFSHVDRDHAHFHILINRVHPETGRAWSNSHDRKRIMTSLRALEKEMDLTYVPNRLTDPDRDLEPGPSRDEYWRAKRADDTPRARWCKEAIDKLRSEIGHHFVEATSWRDLEDRLAGHGLTLERKGQGFVVTNGKRFAKLSLFGKSARKAELEKRFGEAWDRWEPLRDAARVADPDERPWRPDDLTTMKVHERLIALHDAEREFRAFSIREREAIQLVRRKTVMLRKLRQLADYQATRRFQTESATADYAELMGRIYRNPVAAMSKVDAELNSGKDWKDIKPNRVGRLQGWRVWGFASDERRASERAVRFVARAYQAVVRAEARLETSTREIAILQAKINATGREQERVKVWLGDHRQRQEERLRLWRTRDKAVRAVSEADIWRSRLPDDLKKELASIWTREVDRRAQRERAKLARGQDTRSDWQRVKDASANRETRRRDRVRRREDEQWWEE
jgi:MobA/VirD2-like, nuclease domain/TraI-like middle domain